MSQNIYELWIADSSNGSVAFDAPPSRSDIRNACEDLEHPITVSRMELQPISSEVLFVVNDDDSDSEDESPEDDSR